MTGCLDAMPDMSDEEKEKAKQEALEQQNSVQLEENQRIEEDGNIVTE